MRNFTIFLTLLLLFVVGGVRADVITTKPLPGVEYKIKCIATDHNGYLGDDGSTLQGRHATGTIFVLEATTTAGQYYLKSKETGKYINAAGVTSGSAISFDADPTTYWTLDQTNANVSMNSWAIRPNGTAGVSLNNNGAAGNTCPYMKVNVHNSTTQGCDLWTFDDIMDQQTPSLPSGKYIRVSSTKADFLTTATGADDNAHWYLMTQTRNGETPMYDNGMSTIKRAATSEQVAAQPIAGKEKYLVRFFSTSTTGQYLVQFGTGRYIASDLTVNSRAGAQPYIIYNINGEATHIGWNLPNAGGTHGSRVDNNGAGSTLAFWETGLITGLNGNNDWSLYPVEFVDGVNVAYTLSAAETGETFMGSYEAMWNGAETLQPVIPGAGAYTLSHTNFVENGDVHTLTAVINFPFPVSSATKKTPTGIQSKLGPAYWRAKPNGDAYEAYSTNTEATITLDNADQFQWYIYPSFADGTFSFKIQNKVSGMYLPSLSAAQSVNTVNNLVDEASAGTYYYMSCIGEYYGFSINAAGTIFLTINTGSTDNQRLWAWTKSGSHQGSNLTFPAITKGAEYIDATLNKFKSAPTFNILAGSTVVGPSEFAAPAEINQAITDALNVTSEDVAVKYDFINSEIGQKIQTYLNAVNTYGALTNYQFEVKYPYSTLILPCPSMRPSGITLYNCSATEANGYTLTLAEVSGNMTPNTPYIIASTVGNKYTIIGWDKGSRATHTPSGSWLTGVLTEGGVTVPADSYVLAAKNGQQGFYQTDGSVTCPQYKCYLTVPASAGSARAFYFPGDEPTSIEGIFAADESGTVSIYNLAGQKLNRLQKGVNIVNGRKVVVK